jgi:hypothetical protein
MTPFVCHVTGANMDASPIDYDYAIPPRRCLDPTLCNFGPRQPAYWLGTGDHINMPEDTSQSPSYSILYGKEYNVPPSVTFLQLLFISLIWFVIINRFPRGCSE